MVLGLLASLAWCRGAQAQAVDHAALEEALQAGVRALEAADADGAIDRLEAVLDADDAYVSPTYGAAAYWLGRAYEVGDPESGADVWKEGLAALDRAGRFDARLADAFIQHTFLGRRRRDYAVAADTYLRWLLRPGLPLLPPYLEALRIVLPEPVRRATGLDGVPAPDAGARLAAWWRSRDPAPATRNNELLEAHLERLFYVDRHYRDRDGLDDRGKVYLRLGPPSGRTHVTFDRTDFREKVLRRNLTLNPSDFPDNELWVYEDLGRDAQFLFSNRSGTWRLGEANDLLPSVLRNGLGNTARGSGKAEALIRSMEEIYRQLSLWHPLFAGRYTEVTDYVGQLDAQQISQEMADTRSQVTQQRNRDESIEEGATRSIQEQLASRANASPEGLFTVSTLPHVFAQSLISQAGFEDREAAVRREENLPRTYVDVRDGSEVLPVFVRTARFLDEDGTTRTEVYWGPAPGGIVPSKKQVKRLRKEGYEAPYTLMMVATVVQQTAGYRDRVVRYYRHLMRAVTTGDDQLMPPRVYTATGDTGIYHLALQWDLYAAASGVADPEAAVLQERLKMNTHRLDTLRALDADARYLEMSDLKPFLAPGVGLPAEDPAAEDPAVVSAAVPYPYAHLTPRTPLGLYFEVYHLAFGADDRTHYTVTYEVVRARKNGGFLRLKKGRPETRTTASTTYSSPHRTSKEVILLDLNDWEGEGELEIHVRITDEVTGRKAGRAVRFMLTKPE